MLFILLELRAAYGEGDGEHAEAGIQVRGIRLDIVNADAEGADGRDETRQIELVFQLQMHLKMVRAVLQMCFERRKARHTAQQREKQHQRQRIQSRAERQPHDAAAPEADGGRQALDLVLGAEEDGIGADRRDADDGSRRQNRDRDRQKLHEILIDEHRGCAREAHENERAKTGRVPLARTFAADDGGQRHAERQPEKNRAGRQLRAPQPRMPQFP